VFQRDISPPCSGLVDIQRITWHYVPEGRTLHLFDIFPVQKVMKEGEVSLPLSFVFCFKYAITRSKKRM
jgi:hypothetical protein